MVRAHVPARRVARDVRARLAHDAPVGDAMTALLAAALQTTLLGFRVRVVDPVWLWLAPLGLAAGAAAAWRVWRRWRRARSAVPQARRELVLPGGGASQGVLRGGLLGLGLSRLAVGAAG